MAGSIACQARGSVWFDPPRAGWEHYNPDQAALNPRLAPCGLPLRLAPLTRHLRSTCAWQTIRDVIRTRIPIPFARKFTGDPATFVTLRALTCSSRLPALSEETRPFQQAPLARAEMHNSSAQLGMTPLPFRRLDLASTRMLSSESDIIPGLRTESCAGEGERLDGTHLVGRGSAVWVQSRG